MMKKFIALLLSLAMMFSLAACSSNEPKADGEDKDKEITIGFCIISTQAEFLVAMVQGAQAQADEMGVKLIVKDANVSAQTQQEQVEDLISQGVSAIIIEPWDSDAIVTSIKKANEAGIPVFTCDTTAAGGEFLSYIASDNIEMGRMAGEYIAEQLNERYGEYKGTVVNLLASLTSSNGKARSQGFREVMEQYPNIEIIEKNGDLIVETAMNAMTDILQANEKIDAVWCSGDNNAIAAIQAVEAAGLEAEIGSDDRIIIVSGDGGSEILQDLKNGTCDACVSQQPITMGKTSVKMAVEYVRDGIAPASDVVNVDLYTLTADNLDSDEVKAFGLWADEVK